MEQPDVLPDSDVVEVAAEETKPEAVEVPETEVEAPEVSAEAEDEEIDYEGEKYKVPKKLKDAFLRQADYTRKTQEVAEQRKSIEVARQQIQQQAQMQQAYVAEIAEAMSIDKQLEQYQQLDWKALIDSDPVQAMKLDRDMRSLQERKYQVVNSITQKQQQTALQQQQATARQMQEARGVLERGIPGWSPGNDIDSAVRDFADKAGIPSVNQLVSMVPAIGVILHQAMQFSALQKQAAQPKIEVQEKPPTRITATKANAKVDPDKLSADDWLKWRTSQIRKRA